MASLEDSIADVGHMAQRRKRMSGQVAGWPDVEGIGRRGSEVLVDSRGSKSLVSVDCAENNWEVVPWLLEVWLEVTMQKAERQDLLVARRAACNMYMWVTSAGGSWSR